MAQPEIVLSDQGRNFESTIFKQTLEVFGVKKVRITAYYSLEWLNISFTLYFSFFIRLRTTLMIGKSLTLCLSNIYPFFY